MSDAGHAGGPAVEGGGLGLDGCAELERPRAEVTTHLNVTASLGAGLLIFRGVYLNSVPNDVLPASAAGAFLTGPVGTWTYTHRRGLRISAVALAALPVVFWGQPSVPLLIVVAVLLLVVLGLIEMLGSRPPAQPSTP